MSKQTHNTLSTVLNHKKSFLFQLEPYFASDCLYFTNRDYFPENKISKSMKKVPFTQYVNFKNPYMENEIKGFIRHLIIEQQLSAISIMKYIRQFCSIWAKFVNENYPYLDSCIEIEFNKLKNEFKKYLENNNIKIIIKYKSGRVKSNNEWGIYDKETPYLSNFNVYYTYIYDLVYANKISEKSKDVWDVRKLGIPFTTLPSRPRYTLNFSNISQTWLKEMLKDYTIYRLQYVTIETARDDLFSFDIFSEFLRINYPNITELKSFNRTMAENYISFVRSKGYYPKTTNKRITSIKTLFLKGNLIDPTKYPVKPLFTKDDNLKIPIIAKKPLSDYELSQINEHITELPIQYARMLFILENVGMRLSDIGSTTIMVNNSYCLTKKSEDKYVFTYSEPKVHRTHSIPVSEIVAEVINSAIEASRELYGENVKYIFAEVKNKCMNAEKLVELLHVISKRNGLLNDIGEPLWIKGHDFRRTKASEYANMGISVDLIRIMLGQKRLGVLKHYITIHSTSMVDVMQNIIDKDNYLIENMGNVQSAVIEEQKEDGLLPLSNGYCAKSAISGLCEHSYSCYTCRMYKPSIKFMSVYKTQLKEAENNIQIAKMNGYERILQINEDLKEQLTSVINSLEKGENSEQ